MNEVPTRELFINGKWAAPRIPRRLDVINPSTKERIGTIPAGSEADVDAAVAAARAAQAQWAATAPSKRAAFLRAIAEQARTRKTQLARLESLDMGKALDESEWDLDDVAGCFDYYAGLADELEAVPAQPIETGMEEFKCKVQRSPIGVAALITPWNYPMLMATWKIAPALAAGCCVVLKPSEVASLTCLEFGDIADAVGLPPGVLNIVTGLGPDVGAPLACHKGIAKVAFTGSVATGRRVSAAAAANLTPCTLELGGKSALIVFEDTDLDKAVEWAMFGCFWTNGQICSSTSRLLVQESVADAFFAKLKARSEAIQICDPLQPGCRMGPVVNESQYNKVLAMIEMGKQEGASLLTGGGPVPHMKAGYYIQPTVFTGVRPHMSIWTEEIFGPVLSAATFKTEAEAIDAANASRFGLAAAVISDDLTRCQQVADALDVGIVWVNCSQPAFCQAPWGGTKESGIGRELGPWGLANFLSVKQVTEYVSADRWSWYPVTAPTGTSRL